MIPLSIPNFEGNEKKYVNDAVEQGWVSTGGAYISRLEKDLSDFLRVPQVAAVQSGTAAIHLALIQCGVGPGDVVLVPTLTFIAAVNPVKYQQAEPVFIDCDDSLCMDPVKVERFCEEYCEEREDGVYFHGKRVKALIVVHVFGNMADMESLMRVARLFHIAVIEDATEALGTYYTEGEFANRYAGTIGDFGAYSFNGNKIITTGGGGAVTARQSDDVNHMRYLSTQAKDDPHFYIHHEIGYNYRMTNLQAAVGVAQLEELPEFIRRKQNNFARYQERLGDFEGVLLKEYREGTSSNQWFYALEIDRSIFKLSMRELVARFDSLGIQTRAIWGLIHEQQPYKDHMAYRIEKAKKYADSILNIPCSTNLSEDEIDQVVQGIHKVFSH